MTNISISATKRTDFGKGNSRIFRNQGLIPATIYGPTTKAQSILIQHSDILKTWRIAKSSKVIDLTIDKENHEVLIKKLDLDPVRNTIQHVDLYAIEKGKKLTTKVPVIFNGTPLAVKNLGGTFNPAHTEIEIQCLPRDIPSSFEIDVTDLKEIHSHYSIADLNIDEEKHSILHLTPDMILCGVAGRKAQTDEDEIEDTESEENAEEETSTEEKTD